MNQPLANPYVGPRSFLPGERLYGRDRELRDLFGLLVAERIVLLHSPSGAGKTSLIQAALIPKLREADFRVLPIVRVGLEPPATDPAGPNRYALSTVLSLEAGPDAAGRPALDAAIDLAAYLDARDRAEGKADTVLIFDQFEEVLTADPLNTPAKQEFFVQLGAALRDRRRWALFAIREDYLGALKPFLRAVPTRLETTFRLDLLDVPGARAAIQGPARAAGVDFTAGAAQALADDLRRAQVQRADGAFEEQLGPGIEPVQLQVVCYRLWQRLFGSDSDQTAGDGTPAIVPADLEGVADVDSSLAEYYAERVAGAAADSGVDERAIREWVERRLITPLGIRSQVLRGAEASEGLPNAAVQSLIDAYLVRAEPRRGLVWLELAHDRLVGPVRANNAEWFAAELSPLQRQADAWAAQGRPDSLLLRDADLAGAEAWAEAHAALLTPVEREFLERCRELRDSIERERRQVRRIRVLAGAATAVAVVAVVALVAAVLLFLDSGRKERLAQARFLAAAAPGQIDIDPEFAVILAREAVLATTRAGEPAESSAISALYQATGAARLRQTFVYTDERYALTISPDGSLLASAGKGGTIDVINLLDGTEHQIVAGRPVYDIAFSPDGSQLAFISVDAAGAMAEVWDLNSGASYELPHPAGATPSALAFSPDGRELATAANDDVLRIWDLQADRLRELPALGGRLSAVAFSPDGRLIAVGSADGFAQVLDRRNGGVVARQGFSVGLISDIAFNARSNKIAVSDASREPVIWKFTDGEWLGLLGHSTRASFVSFDRNHERLATSAEDGTVRIWDAEDGIPLLVLSGHKGRPTQIAFSRDGDSLFSASADGLVRVWDLRGSFPAPLSVMAVSPDRQMILAGGDRIGPMLIDQASGALIEMLDHEFWPVEAVAFSDDGARFAASSDGQVIVWDAASRSPLQTFQGPGAGPIDLNHDGSRLIVGAEGAVLVYEVASGAELSRVALSDSSRPLGLDLHPDDNQLAIVVSQDELLIWDLAAGRELVRNTDIGYTGRVRFSPRGGWLAATTISGELALWTNDDMHAIPGLIMQPAPIHVFSFSPDGSMLAVGSEDQHVALIRIGPDIQRSIAIERIFDEDPPSWVERSLPRDLVFGADDSLSVAGNNGLLQRYPLSLEALLDLAEERIIRQPTAAECEQFLLDDAEGCG